jgi:hypothetical protein
MTNRVAMVGMEGKNEVATAVEVSDYIKQSQGQVMLTSRTSRRLWR